MDDLQAQFSSIYDQYIEKIYRFVYLKVSSQEMAEDITSRVFIKGWESYQGGKNIKNPSAFLYQIARNMVVDHYRQGGRTKVVSSDNVPEIMDNKVNLHERAVLNSEIETIKIALDKLKKDYQDVIILHYLEDMPVPEVAMILDKPAGTVRVMIHRGLEMLRGELEI